MPEKPVLRVRVDLEKPDYTTDSLVDFQLDLPEYVTDKQITTIATAIEAKAFSLLAEWRIIVTDNKFTEDRKVSVVTPDQLTPEQRKGVLAALAEAGIDLTDALGGDVPLDAAAAPDEVPDTVSSDV